MAKYTLMIDGERIKARPIVKLEYRNEHFFLHVDHLNENLIGITHTETGLSAGRIDRYTGYLGINYKRIAHDPFALQTMALAYLSRIPEARFESAMRKARGGAS